MSLPPIFHRLRLPVIGSPLFIVSSPELVIAQCKAGIVGSFPALNARPQSQLDEWLHRIEVIGQGRAKNEYVYTYSDAELKRTLADLQRRGKRIKEPVQRYKGLGEMDADQLAETTMDPRRRILRRISLSDAEAAEKMFELLMGTDVAPRKEYIVNSAALLDRSRIDV